MKAIKGIFFDKDGVLVDFQRTYAPSTAEVIAVLSGKEPELIEAMAQAVDFDPGKVSFGAQSIVIAGTAADIARAWHPHLPKWQINELITRVEDLYDAITVKHVSPFEDVADTLTALKQAGLALGVATNDTQESAHRHTDAIGIRNSFDFISGYDSGHGPKPEPGMILAFARAIGATPAQIIMIGDSLHDLHSARAAGAIGVGITTGMAGSEVLSTDADHVISALAHLPELVEKLNAANV